MKTGVGMSPRMHVMAIVAAGLALAMLSLGPPAQAGATVTPTVGVAAAIASKTPPNIVMIMTDDQPLGRLNAMPNVKALLAHQGVTYPNSLIPTSACCPSRTTMLTGRYSHTTGIYTNLGPDGGWPAFNASGREQSTLATWLSGAGYRTALVGKYLNDFGKAPAGYVPPGWDRFAGLLSGGYYYNYTLRLKDSAGTSDVSYGSAEPDYSTDVLSTLATDFVTATPATKPLFLMFTPLAPHAPFTPAVRDIGTVPVVAPTAPDINERGMSDKPRWLQKFRRRPVGLIARRVAQQKETLHAVDEAVANIVTALGPRVSNTLFVFTSDNGLMLGSHRLWGKSVPYARASEVPLILRWDGHLLPATTDRRLAVNLDVTATLLDAAGVRHSTSGYSLLRPAVRVGTLLEGGASLTEPRPPYCAWRTRRWLYTEYTGHQGRELYDYRIDPYELHNLVGRAKYRHRVRQMRAAARAACKPVPPGFRW